jgi:hypothetical protein
MIETDHDGGESMVDPALLQRAESNLIGHLLSQLPELDEDWDAAHEEATRIYFTEAVTTDQDGEPLCTGNGDSVEHLIMRMEVAIAITHRPDPQKTSYGTKTSRHEIQLRIDPQNVIAALRLLPANQRHALADYFINRAEQNAATRLEMMDRSDLLGELEKARRNAYLIVAGSRMTPEGCEM